MGRHDKKLARREGLKQQQLEKFLARNDLDRSIALFREIGAADRERWIAPLADLLARRWLETDRRRDAQAERALLGAMRGLEGVAKRMPATALWLAFQTALGAGVGERAGLWALVRDDVARADAAAAEAVDRFLAAGAGPIDDETAAALAAFGERDHDPRLGYEPAPSQPATQPMRHVSSDDAVLPALTDLAVSRSLAAFAEEVETYARRHAGDPRTRLVLDEALRLALGLALRAEAAGEGRACAWPSAIPRLVRAALDPRVSEEFEEPLGALFRTLTARCRLTDAPVEPAALNAEESALPAWFPIVARCPSLGDLFVPWLEGIEARPELARALLRVWGDVMARSGDRPGVFVRGVLLWKQTVEDEKEEMKAPPPSILARASEYEREPGPLAARLTALAPEQQQRFVVAWGHVERPLPLLEALFHREPGLRRVIANQLAGYFMMTLNMEGLLGGVLDLDDDVLDVFASPEYARFRRRQKAEFTRCAPMMAPHSLRWVTVAGEVLGFDEEAVLAVARAALGEAPDGARLVDVARALDLGGQFYVAGIVINDWVGENLDDPERFAGALVRFDSLGGRRSPHFKTVAQAFWNALARRPDADSSAIHTARGLAKGLEPRARKPRATKAKTSPAAKKPAAKKPAKKAPAKRARRSEP